jgi:predicted negative regulator of RcsB-dependent stress response
MRQGLNLALGQAQELLLHDDTAALAAYRAVYGHAATVGGADELGAVQGVARVLTRQQQTDAALAELARIDTGTIGGTWRHSTLLARAEAHAAAGRKTEAVALCREVLADETAEKRHHEAAAAKVREWE